MRGGMRKRNLEAIGLAGLALAAALLAGAWMGATDATAAESVIWMRIEANNFKDEAGHVKVNLPLSLIEVVVDSIDKRDFMSEFEEDHPSLNIPKMWREIRKMDVDEFITVESEKENIKVFKDRDFFRISITEAEFDEPNIEVKLPLELMDYVFEGRKNFDFQELVGRLRGHLPLTVVSAKHEGADVKIWLEEK